MNIGDWINRVDLNKLELYPLQVANCERIHNNDAVYLFDEVGTGKTISAGMMTLEYLNSSKNKSVLIITTNTLSKSSYDFKEGQFLKDWFDKLPFESMDYEKNIKVINNHYSNIKKNRGYWGLIIIDEAHLFLNKESLRYKCITSNELKADKVIIMTASPIKNSANNLDTYKEIADKILSMNTDGEWIDQLKNNSERNSIICSQFNINSPVTRYFKDTVTSINVEGFVKRNARRLLPEIWTFNGIEEKNRVMVDKIKNILNNKIESKFVIFTRYIEKEAYSVGRYLKEKGFSEFNESEESYSNTYYIVTGENRYDLARFTRGINLPTVLIVTYQIAEQGVNLPGFNYVINYHISAYPSSLEQRFGRIDRMSNENKCFHDISMIFLLNNYMDNNSFNFYQAISTYMYNMISIIPSKNTLLTETIIDRYFEASNLAIDYIRKIKILLKNEVELKETISYFYSNDIDSSIQSELIEFCKNNDIEFEITTENINEEIKLFKNEILIKLQEIENTFRNMEKTNPENIKAIIKEVGDKVFYKNKELETLDAVQIGNDIVNQNLEYKNYNKQFKDAIKILLTFNKYRERIEKFIEKLFNEDLLNEDNKYFKGLDMMELFVFPEKYEYEEIMKENIFNKNNKVEVEDFKLLSKRINEMVISLPFFRMCKKYKEIVQRKAYTKDGYLKTKNYREPVTTRSLDELLKMKYSFGVSKEFFDNIIKDKAAGKNSFRIDADGTHCKASPWLKLFYRYSTMEEFGYCTFNYGYPKYNRYNIINLSNGDIYFRLDSLFNELKEQKYYLKLYENLQLDYKNGILNCDYSDIINRIKVNIAKINEDKNNIRKRRSLFKHFFYTERGKYRSINYGFEELPFSILEGFEKLEEYSYLKCDDLTRKIITTLIEPESVK